MKRFTTLFNARLDDPLAEEMDRLWTQAFDELKAGGLDPMKLALKIQGLNPTSAAASARTRGDALLALWNQLHPN